MLGSPQLLTVGVLVLALFLGAKWQRAEGYAECAQVHAAAAAKASEEQRAKEQQWSLQQRENAREVQALAERSRRAARDLGAAAPGLRSALGASVGAPGEGASTPARGPAAGEDPGVRSVVLGEIEARLRALAAAADERGAAGELCERNYDAVTP